MQPVDAREYRPFGFFQAEIEWVSGDRSGESAKGDNEGKESQRGHGALVGVKGKLVKGGVKRAVCEDGVDRQGRAADGGTG